MNTNTTYKLYELKGTIDTAIELVDYDDSINHALLIKIQSHIEDIIKTNNNSSNVRVI